MTPERGATLMTIAALSVSACATTVPRAPVAAAAFAAADSTATSLIVPGVTHTFVRDARGPWAIHVLEIDTRRCVPALEARKPGRDLHARATTSQIAGDALAAINADFFMLPRGTPVGAHVTGGVPLTGPTDRPVFAATSAGWRIGTAGVSGHARARQDSAPIAQINRAAARTSAYAGTRAGLTLFTTWIGDSTPGDSAAYRISLGSVAGSEAGGRGVVIAIDTMAGAAEIRSGTAVLLAHGAARAWARRRTVGDTVTWNARVTVDVPAAEIVGGFPQLLRAGRPVLSEQTIAPGFAGRHPRTAIGWTPDARLFLVVVDGRQAPWSDGMSLAELTWLFRSLGASDAINLDGGGSTAMVITGRVVNRPSDREGERAVGNALALVSCR